LAIKVSQGKEQPLDIKIEGGSISIKGEVINERKKVGPDGKEQVVSRSSSYFSRTMAIPNDVYGEKAQFENKDGSVFIKFPKRLASKKPIKKQKKPKNGPDVRPLKKDSSDITI
jgi:HSP20 family molecular chaperone IbpA